MKAAGREFSNLEEFYQACLAFGRETLDVARRLAREPDIAADPASANLIASAESSVGELPDRWKAYRKSKTVQSRLEFVNLCFRAVAIPIETCTEITGLLIRAGVERLRSQYEAERTNWEQALRQACDGAYSAVMPSDADPHDLAGADARDARYAEFLSQTGERACREENERRHRFQHEYELLFRGRFLPLIASLRDRQKTACELHKRYLHFFQAGQSELDKILSGTPSKYEAIIRQLSDDPSSMERLMSEIGAGAPFEDLAKLEATLAEIAEAAKVGIEGKHPRAEALESYEQWDVKTLDRNVQDRWDSFDNRLEFPKFELDAISVGPLYHPAPECRLQGVTLQPLPLDIRQATEAEVRCRLEVLEDAAGPTLLSGAALIPALPGYGDQSIIRRGEPIALQAAAWDRHKITARGIPIEGGTPAEVEIEAPDDVRFTWTIVEETVLQVHESLVLVNNRPTWVDAGVVGSPMAQQFRGFLVDAAYFKLTSFLETRPQEARGHQVLYVPPFQDLKFRDSEHFQGRKCEGHDNQKGARCRLVRKVIAKIRCTAEGLKCGKQTSQEITIEVVPIDPLRLKVTFPAMPHLPRLPRLRETATPPGPCPLKVVREPYNRIECMIVTREARNFDGAPMVLGAYAWDLDRLIIECGGETRAVEVNDQVDVFWRGAASHLATPGLPSYAFLTVTSSPAKRSRTAVSRASRNCAWTWAERHGGTFGRTTVPSRFTSRPPLLPRV